MSSFKKYCIKNPEYLKKHLERMNEKNKLCETCDIMYSSVGGAFHRRSQKHKVHVMENKLKRLEEQLNILTERPGQDIIYQTMRNILNEE